MEQFVLGIFQEQLSRFIIGFRKEQVNANLLNGKGEITDVELNCQFLNEFVTKVTPFIELLEVKVSRLSFHVSSWTNLRKAPIVVDIEHVHAVVQEPLDYLDRTQRKRIRQLTKSELIELIRAGLVGTRGPYNLFDRILDNLTVEIASIEVSFQTWGRFKTRRPGPWTPPQLQLTLASLRLVSVDEYGCEGQPDQVWRHNHHHDGYFFNYKKVEFEYAASLKTDTQVIPLVSGRDNLMEVQLALQRRIRDGEVLAVQVDVTIPAVEIDLPSDVIPLLAHAMAGVKYCLAKDRAVLDPLQAKGATSQSQEVPLNEDPFDAVDSTDAGSSSMVGGELVAVEDDLYSSSSSSEGETAEKEPPLSPIKGLLDSASTPANRARTASSSSVSSAPGKPATVVVGDDRPVILLPNGIVIHEKLSLSVSIHHATVRGTYVEDGHIQLVSKGVIGEAIWPQVTQKKGGYAQASVSFVSIQERCGSRVRTILVGGAQYDSGGPVERPTPRRMEMRRDETFPLYEERSVRPDPLGLRYTFPGQAFGLKATIDFVKKLSDDPDCAEEEIQVLHEIGVDDFDIVLDSLSWCRAIRFTLNEEADSFDHRWHSGDWSQELTQDMLVNPSLPLNLEECTQPAKQLFLDENEFPSSDLFNLTARIKRVDLRVPAAIVDDIRSCDIVLGVGETMFVVSSALPRTFLSGKLGSSINGEDAKGDGSIDFPNDPSDVSYQLERSEDPSNRQRGVMTSRAISTFRVQLTVRNVGVRLVPIIPDGVAEEPQQFLAPTELTMIVCFEGEPPDSLDSNLTKIVLFTSVLANRLDVNFDFDLATSAIGTLMHHVAVLRETALVCNAVMQQRLSAATVVAEPIVNESSGKIRRSFEGRKVRVRRQIQRSRETGGLSVAFGFQAAAVSFTLWRQNVPYGSPFRESFVGAHFNDRAAYMPLMKLLKIEVSKPECGIEGTFLRGKRRAVLKFCLSEMVLQVCDLTSMLRNETLWVDGGCRPEGGWDLAGNSVLLDILTIGHGFDSGDGTSTSVGDASAFAVRMDEEKASGRSWSLAVDAEGGLHACCQLDAVEAFSFLVFEALLMPAWSKTGSLEATLQGPVIFPSGSVGSLLQSVSEALVPVPAVVSSSDTRGSGGLEGSSNSKSASKMMSSLIPRDVEVFFCRISARDVFLKVPIGSASCDGYYGLLVEQLDFLATHLTVVVDPNNSVLNVLGRKGSRWSSIISSYEEGLRHCLASRQKLLRCLPDAQVATLVESFDTGYTFELSKLHVNSGEKLLLNDLGELDGFLVCGKSLSQRGKSLAAKMSRALMSVRRPGTPREKDVVNGDRSSIEIACSSTASCVLTAKSSMRAASELILAEYSRLHERLKTKNDQLLQMKRLLFESEKQRLAALALVASQATGWLRIGSSQRIGQRGLLAWNLWPQWAVLCRSLLITFSSPNQVSTSPGSTAALPLLTESFLKKTPQSIINIQGAALRELSGGRRKRDLKRAFAIVERTGAIHLVVAGSDSEFFLWVHELHRIIASSQSIEEGASHDLTIEDASQTSDSESRRTTDDDTTTAFGPEQVDRQQRRPMAARFSKAVEAAKATGQAVVERGRKRQDGSKGDGIMDVTGPSLFSEESSLDGGDRPVPLEGTDPGRAVGKGITMAVQVAKATSSAVRGLRNLREADEDDTGNSTRSQQLRTRFAGVGQATKNRFGSALQVARQKSRDVTQNTRARIGHGVPSPLDRVNEEPAETKLSTASGVLEWQCEVCTFLNDGGSSACDMCGAGKATDIVTENQSTTVAAGTAPTLDSVGDSAPHEVADTSEVQVSDPIEQDQISYGADEKETSGWSSEDEASTQRFGVTRRLGAAVRSVRRNKGTPDESNKFSLRPRGRASLDPIPGTPDVVKLRNVKVGGPLSVPLHPIHGVEPPVAEVVCKRLEGCWIARVETLAAPTPADSIGARSDGIAVASQPFAEEWTSHSLEAPKPSPEEVSRISSDDGGNGEEFDGTFPAHESITVADAAVERATVAAPEELVGLSNAVTAEPSKSSRESSDGEVLKANPLYATAEAQSVGAGPTDPRLDHLFQIHLLRKDAVAEHMSTVTKPLADILDLHTLISQSLDNRFFGIPRQASVERRANGETPSTLAASLGLTTLDTVRLTSKLLAALLEGPHIDESVGYNEYCGTCSRS